VFSMQSVPGDLLLGFVLDPRRYEHPSPKCPSRLRESAYNNLSAGLLRSQLYTYAEDLLVNFMDLVESYGFLPNGGRKYYLNRSQPPVFTMVRKGPR
jgi:hypothetical protein